MGPGGSGYGPHSQQGSQTNEDRATQFQPRIQPMAKMGNPQEEAIDILNRGGANANKSEQKHDSQER